MTQTEKLYRVAGRRRLYTLADALRLANEIAAKTGIIVSVEKIKRKCGGRDAAFRGA